MWCYEPRILIISTNKEVQWTSRGDFQSTYWISIGIVVEHCLGGTLVVFKFPPSRVVRWKITKNYRYSVQADNAKVKPLMALWCSEINLQKVWNFNYSQIIAKWWIPMFSQRSRTARSGGSLTAAAIRQPNGYSEAASHGRDRGSNLGVGLNVDAHFYNCRTRFDFSKTNFHFLPFFLISLHIWKSLAVVAYVFVDGSKMLHLEAVSRINKLKEKRSL